MSHGPVPSKGSQLGLRIRVTVGAARLISQMLNQTYWTGAGGLVHLRPKRVTPV